MCARNPIERNSYQPDQSQHMLRKRNGRGKLKYVDRNLRIVEEKEKEKERDQGNQKRRKKIVAKRRKIPGKEKVNKEINCKENEKETKKAKETIMMRQKIGGVSKKVRKKETEKSTRHLSERLKEWLNSYVGEQNSQRKKEVYESNLERNRRKS